ncbi:MAG: 3'-5' exonuclease, partial [Planctomycetota bacterium]
PPDQAERLSHARRVLGELYAGRSRFGPGALLERAVTATGYDGSLLLEFLGERKLANLRKLQRMAREADAQPEGSLRGFAARLLESVRESLDEGEAAAVRDDPSVVTLMTVHKSKGLEFPIVVACDLDRPSQPPAPDGTFDPDLGPIVPATHQHGQTIDDPGADIWTAREKRADGEEAVRLFYVAATRAADRLILSAARTEDPKNPGVLKEPSGIPLATLAAAFDLSTGRPQHADESRPLYRAPAVHVHADKPSGVGKRRATPRRGAPPGKFVAALAEVEPCEPYDLRRPLPPLRPDVLGIDALVDGLATEDERGELKRLLEPPDGQGAADDLLTAAWRQLTAKLFLPPEFEHRRCVDYLLPAVPGVRPAISGQIARLYEQRQGWLAAGVTLATEREMAGDGVPDRLIPWFWAEREALSPLGGGSSILLLAGADGAVRTVQSYHRGIELFQDRWLPAAFHEGPS